MKYTVNNIQNFSHKFTDSGVVKTIKISDGLQSICVVKDENNEIKDLIEEFNSGSKMQKILDNCFIGCKNLSAINIQNQIRYIGKNAFKDCEKLKNINIDVGTYDYIGDMAFANTGIQDINLQLYTSPDGYIGSDIFKDCKQLTSATITTNILPSKLFNGCDNLKNLTVVLSDEINTNKDNVAFDAFSNLTSLADFTLCSQILHDIPLLQNMPKLSSVNIYADVVRHIPAQLFYNTPSLTSIRFQSGVADTSIISPNAFAGSNLQQITFDGIELQSNAEESLKRKQMLLSEPDPYFISATSNADYIKTLDPSDKKYEFCMADPNVPTALAKHISQPDNGKYYYGKIYDDFNGCLSYAIANKIPVLFFQVPKENQMCSKNLPTRKMFYDFLSQQKCLICCAGYKLKHDLKVFDACSGTSFYESNPDMDSMLSGHKGTVVWSPQYLNNTGFPDGYGQSKVDGAMSISGDISLTNNNNVSSVIKFWKGNNNFYVQDREYDLLKEQTNFEVNINRKRLKFGNTGKAVYPYLSFITTPGWSSQSVSLFFRYKTMVMLIIPTSDMYMQTTPRSEHEYMSKSKNNVVMITDVINANVYTGVLETGIYGPGTIYLKYGDTYLDGPDSLREMLANWKYAKYIKEQNLRDSTYSCHFDCETKTRIMILDDQLRELLKDYQRNPQFNAPDWVEDSTYCPKDQTGNRLPLMLEYYPSTAKDEEFTFFGIGHDCTIIDSAGKKLKWSNIVKKLK